MQRTSDEHCTILPAPPDTKPCYTPPCIHSGQRHFSSLLTEIFSVLIGASTFVYFKI